MSTIKKAGLVISLLLASNMANAENYDLYNFGHFDPEGDISVNQDFTVTTAGSFTDYFNFTIITPSSFAALATAAISEVESFTAISLTSGTITKVSGETSTLDNEFSLAFLSSTSMGLNTLLSPGEYILELQGEAVYSGAQYTLDTVTTAVPEPSTIALMLGGLGLVGFMATRRHKKLSM